MEVRQVAETVAYHIFDDVHEAHDKIMHVANLTVRYGRVTALDDVTFSLCRGERVAVVGPNGAGKSTLFKVIAGLIEPDAGIVAFEGKAAGTQLNIAYVPQRSAVDWTFPVTVWDVVMMGRAARIGLLRRPRESDRAAVRESLDRVNLLDLADRQISELSGGQQQRMFIARALAQQANLMLMDEPLSGLDVTSQETIYDVLAILREQGVTVFIATHDLDQAAKHFDRVMLLNHRLLGFDQPQEVFTPHNLAATFGSQLQLVETEEGVIVLADVNRGQASG
ncbi:MAG: metal ABC transporter ATP-binding protein [Chloroflexota bacterium]|nr:metal ABC transporter ATP-binding protein [Chloroflexota bacterium]